MENQINDYKFGIENRDQIARLNQITKMAIVNNDQQVQMTQQSQKD